MTRMVSGFRMLGIVLDPPMWSRNWTMAEGVANQPSVESMRAMFEAYDKVGFRIETKAVPLKDVEKAWTETESGERTVFTI